jgi:hypothetical protein
MYGKTSAISCIRSSNNKVTMAHLQPHTHQRFNKHRMDFRCMRRSVQSALQQSHHGPPAATHTPAVQHTRHISDVLEHQCSQLYNKVTMAHLQPHPPTSSSTHRMHFKCMVKSVQPAQQQSHHGPPAATHTHTSMSTHQNVRTSVDDRISTVSSLTQPPCPTCSHTHQQVAKCAC